MATTDVNGIVLYEDTDSVSPLHTLLNTGQTSVSNAITKTKDGSAGQIVTHAVADIATRGAKATSYAPTPSKPLLVYRADATAGSRSEVTDDGTTWTTNLTTAALTAALTAQFMLDGTKSTAPPAGTVPIVKFGRRAYTSVSSGQYTIAFGTAFPTGVGGCITFTASGSATAAVGNGDTLTLASTTIIISGQTAGNATVVYFVAWGW